MLANFSDLLDFHLDRGTRPGGRPEEPIGVAWDEEKFAAKVERDRRTVQNWRKGRNKPSKTDLALIETALFGRVEDNIAYGEWRAEIRAAHGHLRSGTGSQENAQFGAPVPCPCNLPFSTLGGLFKGREGALARLHSALARDDVDPARTVAVTGRAVHGLGGVGKTRLAVEYAWQHRDAHAATLFVPADTPTRLATSLAALAGPDALSLPEHGAREDAVKVEATFAWLAAHPGWLLILDNVDDADALAGVTSLLRRLDTRCCRGRVLITGRLSTYPHGVGTLELDVLDPVAATAYLLDATAQRRPAADDEAQARELADALGGLALGLSQAAAYINARRIGLAGYLGLWRTSRERVLSWFDRDLVSYDHDVGLAATWATSVERLTPAARRLLERVAFLHPAPIPDTLLDVPVPDVEEDDNGDTGGAGFDGPAALAELFTYSLATRAELITEAEGASVVHGPAFTVHRLVQDYTRRCLDAETITKKLAESLRWLDKAFVGMPDDVRFWPALDPLAPHALTAARHGDEALIPEPTGRLLNQLGLLLRAKARWREAEPLYRRALAIGEANYGPEHPTVATCVANLAGLLKDSGRQAEAELLFRRALAINEASYDPEHPAIATRLNGLAVLLLDAKRTDEAEPLIRRALTITEASYGPNHPDVATCLNSLAGLLTDTNRVLEAEPLILRALAISEATLGLDHPTVAIRLSNLARLLLVTGRANEAESLMRRALTISEASYGSDHPTVATRLNNLAGLLRDAGRAAEAEPLFRRAVAITEASLAPNHPIIAIGLKNLARLLQANGRASEAEPLLRRVQAIEKTNSSRSQSDQ